MNRLNKKIQLSRNIFLIFTWVFAISVVIQTFIAGLAIFTDYSYWSYHTTFVIWFQFIPILLLVLSFTGRLPKLIRWQVVGLFLLIVPLQYASIHIPGAGAIHPVIALILFWLAITVIKKVGKLNITDN
ncbi:hypothetical protein DX933_14760 [Ornithinibacillus gellani]|uniref:DUF6220 domain-containing protein n=1 Tax=Ornithinibacillus gellani TaxID=2293253 RepID=UPI000F4675A5|nr:DUF6220 domain-containing protein [Ornithinibacillus gellani]TQS71841.1 hypothetical protein DX933_14760 [Ornithinibacillus gellani]